MQPLTIAIIGAGYSGASLAVNLTRLTTKPVKIILIDQSLEFGLGAAYATKNMAHLLNVRANGMSAFPDQPLDFVHWLEKFYPDLEAESEPQIQKRFIPRKTYGEYIQYHLKKIAENPLVELIQINQTVVDIQQHEIIFSDQTKIFADKMILAIGNPLPGNLLPKIVNKNYIENPWDYAKIEKIKFDQDVLIIGTGLTMIDVAVSLFKQNHQGKIFAISRRGLLPQAHENIKHEVKIAQAALPINLKALTRFIRKEIQQRQHQGERWHATVDALRPYTQAIWQNFSLDEQKRFLKHLQPFWDTHRHRIAPKIAKIIQQMLITKQLQIVSGRITQAHLAAEKFTLHYRPRQSHQAETLTADVVVNCTGPNYRAEATPLVHNLIQKGTLQADQLRMGFATDAANHIINASGQIEKNIFSLGPTCKTRLWEIIAVPDIRVQSLQLAKTLLKSEHS